MRLKPLFRSTAIGFNQWLTLAQFIYCFNGEY